MAEESKYVDDGPVSIYIYVNKESDLVEAIFTFNIVGMAIRRDNDWDVITRQDPAFNRYVNSDNYAVWKVDWSKEPIIDADPADESAWDHQIVQAWDLGIRFHSQSLQQYATRVDPL